MNKTDEKMQALEVLKEACECVTKAMNAMEAFADQHGMTVELTKEVAKQEAEKSRHVTIPELGEMVAEEIGMKPECALAAIACAFDLIGDLDLLVDVEVEDDDED